jgi:uncharacterized protein
MRKTLISLIGFYQVVLNVFLKNILGVNKFCRYSPTCSEYAKNQIRKNGVIKGSAMAIARIATCHPFAK